MHGSGILCIYRREAIAIESYKVTSKFLSLLLRHKPEVLDLHIDECGWVCVDELLQAFQRKRQPDFDREMLEEIVKTDNKQRYSFSEDKTRIRANQGHSIPVDVELEEGKPPEYLWHGTAEKFVASIDQQGLLPKMRLYVHLSKEEETAYKVGKRHGKPVLYRVCSGKMAADGYPFYLSANQIWLTKKVPLPYLEKREYPTK